MSPIEDQQDHEGILSAPVCDKLVEGGASVISGGCVQSSTTLRTPGQRCIPERDRPESHRPETDRSERDAERSRRKDPRDLVDLSDDLDRLSRTLSMVLRHKAHTYGIEVDEDNWVKLSALARCDNLRTVSRDDLEAVVNESYSRSRPRFETQERDGVWYIRATHKHSARSADGNFMNDPNHHRGGRRRDGAAGDVPRRFVESSASRPVTAQRLEQSASAATPAENSASAGNDPWFGKDPWSNGVGDDVKKQARSLRQAPEVAGIPPCFEEGWEVYSETATERNWFWRASGGREEWFFECEAQTNGWSTYVCDEVGRWWWKEDGRWFIDPREKRRSVDRQS